MGIKSRARHVALPPVVAGAESGQAASAVLATNRAPRRPLGATGACCGVLPCPLGGARLALRHLGRGQGASPRPPPWPLPALGHLLGPRRCRAALRCCPPILLLTPLPSPSGLLLWPSPPPPPGWAVLSGPSSAPAARLPSALARGAPSQRACASASCRSGVCPRWGSRLAPVGLHATASRPSAMAPGVSSRRSRARAQIMFLQGPGVRGR